MSRIYLCNAAPLARDWRAAIHANAKWLETFSGDAFLTTAVPVTRGHDGSTIGSITSHATSDPWHVFALTLDEDSGAAREAARRIRVGTGVSIQADLLRTDAMLEETGVRHCTLAKLDHVAVLLDGEQPMYAGAGVTRILEPSKKPTKVDPPPIVRQPATKPPTVDDLSSFLTHQEREQLAHLAAEGFDQRQLCRLIEETCRPRTKAQNNEPATLTRYFKTPITIR